MKSATRPKTEAENEQNDEHSTPVDDEVLDAVEQAVEQCEKPTIARVVATAFAHRDDGHRLETYTRAARQVLGEDAPVTASERGTVEATPTPATAGGDR